MSVVGCQNTFDVNEIMSVMPGNMFTSLKLFSWARHVLLRYSIFPPAFTLMEGSGRLVLISLLWAHLHRLREGFDVLMVLTSLSLYVHVKYDTKLRSRCIQNPVAWLYFASGGVVEMGSLEKETWGTAATGFQHIPSPPPKLVWWPSSSGSRSLTPQWFAWAASSFQDFFQALLQT